MKKVTKFLILIFAVFAILDNFNTNLVKAVSNFGTTFYVATNGSDGNPGTSLEKPFKTIYHAALAMNPGDTVIIRGGIYNVDHGYIINKAGTKDRWCTIKNYNQEKVVLDGGGSFDSAFTINSTSYLKIEGLYINNYTGSGIYMEPNCNNIELDKLTIWGIDPKDEKQGSGTAGIDCQGNSSYISVKNCHIYNIGLKYDREKDHGVYTGYGNVNHWTFENNRIHDNSGAGIQLYSGSKDDGTTGGRYFTIRNNEIFDNHYYGLIVSSDADHNIIDSNKFFGNRYSDLGVEYNANYNKFINNTFGSTDSTYNIVTDSSSQNNTFDYNKYSKAFVDGNAIISLTYNWNTGACSTWTFPGWHSGRDLNGSFSSAPYEDTKVNVAMLGYTHSPLVEGDTESWYVTSDNAGKVQYRAYVISDTDNTCEEITNGYTKLMDARTPYMIESPKKYTVGTYKMLIWVRKEGSSNEYDNTYTGYLNCVPKDDMNRVYTDGNLKIDKLNYDLGEKVVVNGIEGIKGMIGPYKYRLHVYNADTNTWVKNVTDYKDNIQWIPTEPGTYILDVHVTTPYSSTWSNYLSRPQSEDLYGTFEGIKLQTITVNP